MIGVWNMRVAAIVFVLIGSPALANVEGMMFATEIGGLLGSDEACGIVFNQDKVRAYILANTSPTYLSVSNLLATVIQGNRLRLQSEKPSDLAIHCDLAKRSADALGLIDR
jgi:hypothetical protein